jgi:hypothetical protein
MLFELQQSSREEFGARGKILRVLHSAQHWPEDLPEEEVTLSTAQERRAGSA